MSWWLWPLCSQQTKRCVYIAFSCAVCQCRALVAGSGCIVRRGSKNICGLYEADNDVPTPLVATDTRGHIHTIYTATKVLGFQHLSSNGQWLIGMLAILPCVPTSYRQVYSVFMDWFWEEEALCYYYTLGSCVGPGPNHAVSQQEEVWSRKVENISFKDFIMQIWIGTVYWLCVVWAVLCVWCVV